MIDMLEIHGTRRRPVVEISVGIAVLEIKFCLNCNAKLKMDEIDTLRNSVTQSGLKFCI
jgi:hypothetical protein